MALGFIGRIGRAIRNIIAPPPTPREQPPEEPRERGRRGDPYREIWRDHHVKRKEGKYQDHLRVFHSVIDPIEENPDEREALWDSYIRNMVKAESTFRRQDTQNMWWRDSGIDPADFKWQRWREAMGFTGKRRSRTT